MACMDMCQVPGMTVAMSPVSTRSVTDTYVWARLWPAYYKCDVDHRLRE